jgi:tetratricopeptide (TPR) repeat protein
VSSRPSRVGSSPSSASSRLISSCILIFYICLFDARPHAQAPDALYAGRANLASARQAVDLWAGELARNPQAFDAAWKLARADYWVGGHTADPERRRFWEQGIDAGQKAIALQPNRPEGHFWTAANMGGLADALGLRQGVKYRRPIRDELETVLRIAPLFADRSADRALGRWYARVPSIFGGSKKLAEEHFRASLAAKPTSTASHYFFGEMLADDGRKAEARTELQAVLDAPLDPDWTPEDNDFKEKARKLLANLK